MDIDQTVDYNREFEEVYKKTAELVYNVALRITASPDLAEETVQEVYLKVYKNLKKFEYRSDIKTWIYKITVNTAINLGKARSKENRRNVELDESMPNLVGHENDEAPKFVERQSKENLVKKMLGSLDPIYRTCIVLREIEGLSYEEIAKVTGGNINTVRTRIKRAREKLIERFGKEVESHEL